MQQFIGRKSELKKLDELSYLKRPKLVVVKGRRRIGKSRLIREFAKSKRFLTFAGIAPSNSINTQDQKNAFIFQLSEQTKMAIPYTDDWGRALSCLTSYITQEKTVVLLDEISWMGSGDSTFVPKLKNWWDLELQRFPNLILVFCGSVSTWIEENIINSTAFYGRITLSILLQSLSIAESYKFLHVGGFKGSAYEIIKILSLTGGVPWYLEQISPKSMADQNIKRLCFESGGLLVDEFDSIFNDLFRHKNDVFKSVLEILKNGMCTLAQMREILNYSESGTLSNHMNQLIVAGFVTKHQQWSVSAGKERKQSLYRLSDPYIRFYLKYIEPLKNKIEQNFFQKIEPNQIVGFDSIIGFQVEALLLQHRNMLLDALGVNGTDCIFDNPYLQKKNSQQDGLQIDYMVQTRSKNIFICEFKFSKGRIGSEVIAEMEDKISRLKLPKGFAASPVLFYLGELSETIVTSNFFYRLVDIASFLEES